MSKGIVNDNNKDKMLTLLNALFDVLGDDNMCNNKCDENCPYSYLMLGDFFACMLLSTYHILLGEFNLREFNKEQIGGISNANDESK